VSIYTTQFVIAIALFSVLTGIHSGSKFVLHSLHLDTFSSRKSRNSDRRWHIDKGILSRWICHRDCHSHSRLCIITVGIRHEFMQSFQSLV